MDEAIRTEKMTGLSRERYWEQGRDWGGGEIEGGR